MSDDEELIARLRDWEEHDEGKINDAREAAADRIEALGKACTEWAEVSQSNYQRAKAAEAKLAKAVETLDKMNVGEGWAAQKSRAALAEIKGESHD